MRLFELSWGIYPRRVLIYLAEKDLAVERVAIDLIAGENRAADFLKISPFGQLPVLELDNGDVIRQSSAIINYLEERYPSPNLSGSSALAKAKTMEFMSLINEAYIYFNQYSANKSPAFSAKRPQSDEVAIAMYQHYHKVLSQIETLMTASNTFLCGEQLTYADCALFASAQFAQELYQSPLPADCPKITAFYQRFSNRDSAAVPHYPPQIALAAPIPKTS